MDHSPDGNFGHKSVLNQRVVFEILLKKFKPTIQNFTKKYPQKWKDDFFQEGSLALYDAMQKFAIMPPIDEFRPYAIRAIKYRMIDFYRSNIKRELTTEDLHNPSLNIDFDGNTEFVSNLTAEPEFTTTPDFDLDYEIIFSEGSMKAHAFLPKEIKAFNLYTNLEFTVTEIAEQMLVSVGQASKLLSTAKTKSSKLWNSIHSYETKHRKYGKD